MESVETRNGFVVEKTKVSASRCGGPRSSSARTACAYASGPSGPSGRLSRGHSSQWLCHRDIGVSCLPLSPQCPHPARPARPARISQGSPRGPAPGTGGHWPLGSPHTEQLESGTKLYVAAGCRAPPGLKYRRSDHSHNSCRASPQR